MYARDRRQTKASINASASMWGVSSVFTVIYRQRIRTLISGPKSWSEVSAFPEFASVDGHCLAHWTHVLIVNPACRKRPQHLFVK